MSLRATVFLSALLMAFQLGIAPPESAAQSGVNVTTWHQDIPAICTGCVYRTGQNLNETTLTSSNISNTNFGLYCSAALDGQVHGQPLVVTNVAYHGQTGTQTVVYVVTMNDSVYAFDGSPSAPTSWPLTTPCTQLDHINLLTQLGTGEVPPLCSALGATNCQTIAPNVGILSTPVINANTGGSTTTGTLYLVAESVNNSTTTYYHRLWTLDITNLQTTSNYRINPTSCSNEQGSFSQLHLQRPALLLGGDNYLYVAFSMMDGNPTPLPNGMILAYNTASLTTAPLCLAISQGTLNNDGGGIWGGAGGPAYGTDANTIAGSGNGKYYTFFNTANGQFGTNSNYGDSFIKMYNTGTALQFNDYFAPGDQYYRSNKSCNASDGDTDFGSGAPMLIPDGENTTWPTLAVSGDKEGGLWFMDRTIPGQGGSTSCPANSNTNVQTFQITSSFPSGPLIHTNPAFWENTTTNYLFVGSADDGTSGAGQLMRYQVCGTGNPISSTSPCSQTKAVAYESVVASPRRFPWGTTPSISATSVTSPGDAILWAVWGDGSVVPTQSQFYWMHNNKQINFNAAQNGVLYAFDAANPNDTGMKKLFGSSDCMIGGHLVDQINPATKYSVPTVANGYVYLGTQGGLQDPNSQACGPKNPTSSCWMSGTFYIFGHFINPKPCS